MFVGPGDELNVAETVNVQPKLFVNVITGLPAPSAVTVCPLTVPALLPKLEIVWPPLEVLFINITPLLEPQLGLVKLNVAAGLGLMLTVLVAVPVQPLTEVPITV